MTQVFSFNQILEASLDELVEACDPIEPKSPDRLALLYGRVILNFLRGDAVGLEESFIDVSQKLIHHEDYEFVTLASGLRMQLRACQVSEFDLEAAQNFFEMPARWRGEMAMLSAAAYVNRGDYKKARSLYIFSAGFFVEQGCARKALRARLNILVCESCLFPDRNLFSQYHDLYKKSVKKEFRELYVATACLLNISREYQRTGAHSAALKYCDRALELFEERIGDINYFLTLAHRAHLLCEMGRLAEAQLDYESARLGNFKEVAAALEVVRRKIEGVETLISDKNLLPNWQERQNEMGNAPKLSTLENKLIRYLARGPRERSDLITHLYGALLDHETKLNRFKSLLSTFRKKFPHLVLFEDGTYRLANDILVPRVSRKKSGSS